MDKTLLAPPIEQCDIRDNGAKLTRLHSGTPLRVQEPPSFEPYIPARAAQIGVTPWHATARPEAPVRHAALRLPRVTNTKRDRRLAFVSRQRGSAAELTSLLQFWTRG